MDEHANKYIEGHIYHTESLVDGTTLNNETIRKLREKTGVGTQMCKDAFNYAKQRNGNFNMMIAYLKAMSLASYVRPFDAKVDMFLKGLEEESNETLG